MRQLVASWLKAEKEHFGNDPDDAVRRLNEELGTTTTPSRVREWTKGVYCPSQEAISEMLFRTYPWILEQAGISATKAQLCEVDELIWVVVNENEETKRFSV